MGSLIYRIYLRNSDGTETEIGSTTGNSFTYSVSAGGDYTFVVKASYTIYRGNMSKGLIISTRTIDNNVNNMFDDNDEDEDTGLN